jgi:hypothetical protein
MGSTGSGNGHHTKQDEPGHTPGTRSGSRSGGEPGIQSKGRGEAGRPAGTSTPRFATGINPSRKGPIDPSMPHLPPA